MVSTHRALASLAFVLSVGLGLGCNKSQSEVTTTATPAKSGAPTDPATAAKPGAPAEKAYQARGTVKAFGEGRKSIKIAHEEIPGYMKAMTMPFAVTSTNELDGFKEGDAVDFSFSEQTDGRLLIQSIKKR